MAVIELLESGIIKYDSEQEYPQRQAKKYLDYFAEKRNDLEYIVTEESVLKGMPEMDPREMGMFLENMSGQELPESIENLLKKDGDYIEKESVGLDKVKYRTRSSIKYVNIVPLNISQERVKKILDSQLGKNYRSTAQGTNSLSVKTNFYQSAVHFLKKKGIVIKTPQGMERKRMLDKVLPVYPGRFDTTEEFVEWINEQDFVHNVSWSLQNNSVLFGFFNARSYWLSQDLEIGSQYLFPSQLCPGRNDREEFNSYDYMGKVFFRSLDELKQKTEIEIERVDGIIEKHKDIISGYALEELNNPSRKKNFKKAYLELIELNMLLEDENNLTKQQFNENFPEYVEKYGDKWINKVNFGNLGNYVVIMDEPTTENLKLLCQLQDVPIVK